MEKNNFKTAIIIPALNEEKSIALVLEHIPLAYKNCVIVADNGSHDRTVEIAESMGAIIAHAPRKGYGSACLAGMSVARQYKPDVYIFLDADYSDFPEDMTAILDFLLTKDLDLVIGSRNLGGAEKGALFLQARFGNSLATTLMYLRYQYKFSDLGPFRAIRAEALYKLQMCDPDFGWTVEMQIKALKNKLKVGEISVRYRKRVGVSKITGTLKGTIMAGIKIIWTLFRYS